MSSINSAEDAIKYWEPVFKDFLIWYSEYKDLVVDWYPYGQMRIVVKLFNGKKKVFDWFEKTLTPVKTSQFITDDDDEVWKKEFSIRLFRKMRVNGMSQEELSARTGISQVTISRYLNAKVMPSGSNIDRLAYALNCPAGELMSNL